MTSIRRRLSRRLHGIAYRIDPSDEACAVIYPYNRPDIEYLAGRFPDVELVKSAIGLNFYRGQPQ